MSDQRLKTINVLLSLHHVRLSLRQICFRLNQRHLLPGKFEIGLAFVEIAFGLGDVRRIRPQIERIKNLAGANVGPNLEKPLFNEPVYPATNFHHVAGKGLSGVLAVDGHVVRVNFHNRHRRGWKRHPAALRFGGRLARCSENKSREETYERKTPNKLEMVHNLTNSHLKQ